MAIDSAAKRFRVLNYAGPSPAYSIGPLPDGSDDAVNRTHGLHLVFLGAAGSDTDAPLVSAVTIDPTGTTLSVLHNENVTFGAGGNGGFSITASGGAVTPSYSSGSGSTSLVYSLSRNIEIGETLTLDYTQPGDGVEDSSGNDLATFAGQAVTNNSTYETTAPTFVSASVDPDGDEISIVISENVGFGAGGSSGFSLSFTDGAVTATYSSGEDGSELIYTLSRTIGSHETGTIAYTQPGNGIEDPSGNDLATFAAASVTNNSTQDTVTPTFVSASIINAGTQTQIVLSEAVVAGVDGANGFTFTPSGGAATLSYASGLSSTTLIYNNSRTIDSSETITDLAYTQPGDGLQDAAGNVLASFSGQTVVNSSLQHTNVAYLHNRTSIEHNDTSKRHNRTDMRHSG